MLFRREVGKRLEPVRVVGGALGNGPVLHGVGDDARDGSIEGHPLFDRPFERFVHLFGKKVFHRVVIEHIAAEQFGNVHIIGSLQFIGNGRLFRARIFFII